jgi:hypothetical protein
LYTRLLSNYFDALAPPSSTINQTPDPLPSTTYNITNT